MSKKKNIAVLMGGTSTEHEVSIASGSKVVESLNRRKFNVVPVVIGKDGLWGFPGQAPVDIFDAVATFKQVEIDCVLVALHGACGEDGRLQGMLDLLRIPYTSSGCAASALAMDKARSKALVRDAGISVADELLFESGDWSDDAEGVIAAITSRFGFPCVIKAPCQGSSVGMAIPRNEQELRQGIPRVLALESTMMVEEFVAGTEVTCAVLDVVPGSLPCALPVTEIRPQTSSFFDYAAKYTPGASLEVTPAEIAPEHTQFVQETSVRIHQLIGCGIWSRNDFIIGPRGPIWLEINTVPGLTPVSLFPQAAAAAGIPYPALMEMFIDAAIANGRR